MKVFPRLLVGFAVVFALAASAYAQAQSRNILIIQREFVKPGKSGSAHEKSEAAFVQAMARAKWPTHYIAFESLTGKPRVLFFTNYDSFEAWEKDAKATDQNATFSAALDRANEADGSLLDASDEAALRLEPELSFNMKPDLSHRRFLEIWGVHIKPGKDHEFRELTKMYISYYSKAVPNGHWGAYQLLYGGPNGLYLFLTARDTTAELDRGPMEEKAVWTSMPEDTAKKMDEMFADCVQESESQFFSVSASMSYPPEEYIKADPDFWQHKATTTASTKKPEAKTVAASDKKP